MAKTKERQRTTLPSTRATFTIANRTRHRCGSTAKKPARSVEAINTPKSAASWFEHKVQLLAVGIVLLGVVLNFLAQSFENVPTAQAFVPAPVPLPVPVPVPVANPLSLAPLAIPLAGAAAGLTAWSYNAPNAGPANEAQLVNRANANLPGGNWTRSPGGILVPPSSNTQQRGQPVAGGGTPNLPPNCPPGGGGGNGNTPGGGPGGNGWWWKALTTVLTLGTGAGITIVATHLGDVNGWLPGPNQIIKANKDMQNQNQDVFARHSVDIQHQMNLATQADNMINQITTSPGVNPLLTAEWNAALNQARYRFPNDPVKQLDYLQHASTSTWNSVATAANQYNQKTPNNVQPYVPTVSNP